MLTCHLYVSGFVQGVGYRHFVKRSAEELGLTGWVSNLPDGRVEALFQGPRSQSFHSDDESSSERAGQAKEAIEQMIKLCKKGPFLSEIEDVVVEWEESDKQFDSFEIKQ